MEGDWIIYRKEGGITTFEHVAALPATPDQDVWYAIHGTQIFIPVEGSWTPAKQRSIP